MRGTFAANSLCAADGVLISCIRMRKLSTGAAGLLAASLISGQTVSTQSRIAAGTTRAVPQKQFSVVEATIPEMRAAMEQGRITSRDLVMVYLARIGMFEGKLHAVMTVNP